MKAAHHVRVGVFEGLSAANRAVHGLVEAGFSKDQISVVCPTCAQDQLDEAERVEPSGSHTGESVATGGTIGTILGALTATVGIAASGGMGLLVVGPILGGAAVGGITGGFLGAMASRGFEPEIADYYDQALEAGQVLVAVEAGQDHAGPPLRDAERILLQAGADPLKLRKS